MFCRHFESPVHDLVVMSGVWKDPLLADVSVILSPGSGIEPCHDTQGSVMCRVDS